jgi:hypothetical protein
MAQLDCAGLDPLRPYEIAVQIAFHLARRYRDMDRLRFPRLLIGLVALRIPLQDAFPGQAGRQVRQQLRAARRRRINPAQVAALVDAGARGLGLPPVPVTEQVITLLARAFEYAATNSRLNRHLDWYTDATSAEDELIELNKHHRGASEADRDFVDRLLCEAFLADLRAAYAHRSIRQNCLALLDNIDQRASGAAAFLELLAKLRTQHAVSHPAGHDPLLVVATSATIVAVPGPLDGHPDDPRIRRAADASYADWLPDRERTPTSWWYPVRLRDFTEDEVTETSAAHAKEITAWAHRSVVPDLSGTNPLVHRLSYGHPWSVRQLDLAIGERLAAGGSEHRLRGILADPAPDTAGRTDADADDGPRLGAYARAYLLGGLTEGQRVAAIRLSAARAPSSAVNAGLLTGLTEHSRDRVMLELRRRLWLFTAVPEDANTRGGSGPSGYLGPAPDRSQPVLHPWLRLLLLEGLEELGERGELADPDGGEGTSISWQRAHDELRSWHHGHNRRLDASYHLLANDELDTVVAEFSRSFTRPETAANAAPWLHELYYVTAAPMRRAQLTDDPPSRNAVALARRHAPVAYADNRLGRPLAELIAALWLAGDPRNRLPPGEPQLNPHIAAKFRKLSDSDVDTDSDTLIYEAARYSS